MSDHQEPFAQFKLKTRPEHRYVGVMINTDYGGFGLSNKAIEKYREAKGLSKSEFGEAATRHIARTDPVMIDVLLKLGLKAASARSCKLDIKLVPWNFRNHFEITDYDGMESVELKVSQYKLDTIREMMVSAQQREGSDKESWRHLKASVISLIDEDEDQEGWTVEDLHDDPH